MYDLAFDLDDFSYSLESYMIRDYEIGMEGKLGDAFNKVRTGFSGFVKWIGKKISEIAGKILDFIKHPVKSVKAGIAAGKEKSAARKADKQEKSDKKFINKVSGKKKLTKKDISRILSLADANWGGIIAALQDEAGDNQAVFDSLYADISKVSSDIDSSDGSEPATVEDYKKLASVIQKLEKFGKELEKTTASDEASNENKKRSLLTSVSTLLGKIFSKRPIEDDDDMEGMVADMD